MSPFLPQACRGDTASNIYIYICAAKKKRGRDEKKREEKERESGEQKRG